MLYGLTQRDVVRLRQLLIAYEQGRIRLNAPAGRPQDSHQIDIQLGSVANQIPAGGLGTANIVRLDQSNPPNATTDTVLPPFPVYNPNSSALAAGTYLFAREPSEGYYVPCLSSSVSGATGTDGIGNIFLNGLCINVGGTVSTNVVIDSGSDW